MTDPAPTKSQRYFSLNRLLSNNKRQQLQSPTASPLPPVMTPATTLPPLSPLPLPTESSGTLTLDAILDLLSTVSDPQLLLGHLTAAIALLPNHSPCPSPHVILPILSRTSLDADLRAPTFDLLVVYLSAAEQSPVITLGSVDRIGFWSIIKSPAPPSIPVWVDWYPRVKALYALTDGAKSIDGLVDLVQFTCTLAREASMARIQLSLQLDQPLPITSNNDLFSISLCMFYSLSFLTDVIQHNASLVSTSDLVETISTFVSVCEVSLKASMGIPTTHLTRRPHQGAPLSHSPSQSALPSASTSDMKEASHSFIASLLHPDTWL